MCFNRAELGCAVVSGEERVMCLDTGSTLKSAFVAHYIHSIVLMMPDENASKLFMS